MLRLKIRYGRRLLSSQVGTLMRCAATFCTESIYVARPSLNDTSCVYPRPVSCWAPTPKNGADIEVLRGGFRLDALGPPPYFRRDFKTGRFVCPLIPKATLPTWKNA